MRVHQKSNAACRLPYRAFTSSTYNTILPFSVTRYGSYGSGSHCMSKSMRVPLSFMCTISSCLLCMKALGISTVATSCCSSASMTDVRSTASVEIVGQVASSCCSSASMTDVTSTVSVEMVGQVASDHDIQMHCLQSSASSMPFNSPTLFLLEKHEVAESVVIQFPPEMAEN